MQVPLAAPMDRWLIYENLNFYKPHCWTYFDHHWNADVRLQASNLPWLWFVFVDGIGIDVLEVRACICKYPWFWLEQDRYTSDKQMTFLEAGYVWVPYIPEIK